MLRTETVRNAILTFWLPASRPGFVYREGQGSLFLPVSPEMFRTTTASYVISSLKYLYWLQISTTWNSTSTPYIRLCGMVGVPLILNVYILHACEHNTV